MSESASGSASGSASLAFHWKAGLVLEATRKVTRLARQLGEEQKSTETSRYRLVVSQGPSPGQVLVKTEMLDNPQVVLFSIPLPDLVVDSTGSIVEVRGAERVRDFILSTVPQDSPEHEALTGLITPAFVKGAAERDWHPLVSLWAGRSLTKGKTVEVRTRDNSDPRVGPVEMVTSLSLTNTSPITLTARSIPDAASSKRMLQAAMEQIAAALPGVKASVKEQKTEARTELVTDAGLIPRSLRVTSSSSTAIEVKAGADVDLVTTLEELAHEITFEAALPRA